MIDFIKFQTYVNPDQFELCPKLDFKQTYSKKTGELNPYQYAKYYNLSFKLYASGYLLVSGSIHKYYNFLSKEKAPNQIDNFQIQKGYNGNDFNYTQIRYTFQHIAANFGLHLANCNIQNIEIGMNIAHPLETTKILNGLMLQKGKTFNKPLKNTYRQAEHQQYKMKIYDKALQYGQAYENLRIETKHTKSHFLHLQNIYTLSDLSQIENINKLLIDLNNRFQSVLIYDYTIQTAKLPTSLVNRMKDYSNDLFWQSLASNRRDKHKKRLADTIEIYSSHVQKQIDKLMRAKAAELNRHCPSYNLLMKKPSV